MIDLFYYTSPNARKILIALEELAVPYNLVWTNISEGDQFRPEFLKVNPNGKIPAIIDREGPAGAPFAVFESGAILLYLAEKFGRLLPGSKAARWEAICWLNWQVSGQGPMCGQAAHFHSHAAKQGISQPYAAERYAKEARRLYAVLDTHLAGREWIAGEFSIADIACFPWTRVAKGHGVSLDEFPNVARWSNAIAERPAAKRRPEDDADAPFEAPQGGYTNRQWEILFGPSSRQQAQHEPLKETTP
jgi:GST-like protein